LGWDCSARRIFCKKVALSNLGNQNFKKIISAFNPDCSQEEREINEGPLIQKKLKKD